MEKIKSKRINNVEYCLNFEPSIDRYIIYSHDETKDVDGKPHAHKELVLIRNRKEALDAFDSI
jgi:hypothetical protein